MSGAWGTSPWGLGPWGGSVALSVVSAVATSTHTVLVTLTAPPMAVSPINTGDALNPETWSQTAADGTVFTVLAVRQVTTTSFEIRTLEQQPGYLTSCTVSCPTLLTPSGAPLVPPTSSAFPGVAAAVQPFTDAGVTDFDLANPQLPRTGVPGTLRTTSSGDYATEAGRALLEKLVVRAITTQQGGFFFLPNYGFGLTNKQLVTPSKLGALRANLRAVVEQISMVKAADVEVSFAQATGVTTVTVTAEAQDGQTVEVVRKINPPNVSV